MYILLYYIVCVCVRASIPWYFNFKFLMCWILRHFKDTATTLQIAYYVHHPRYCYFTTSIKTLQLWMKDLN